MALIGPSGTGYSRLHAWLRLGALTLAVLSLSAEASSPSEQSHYLKVKIRPSYQRCLDASDGVTPAMKACMSDEFTFQDARLNTAYKKLTAALDDTDRTSLKIAERQWIKAKETTCFAPSHAGQGEELVSYDCAVVQTATRATELEERLNDPVTFGAVPLAAANDVRSADARIGLRVSYQACIDGSFANNPKIMACADEEMRFQELRLRRARERQDASVAPSERPLMAAKQKDWTDALDKQCAIRPDASQSEEVDSATCRLLGTAKRANELEKLLAR